MRSVLTACPFCGCGCGLYLQVEGEQLVGVAPSEHHSVSQGRLCARAWAAHEACHWGERLTAPMIRRNGSLRHSSWEEALRFAVERLSALSAKGRAVCVLGSGRATNEENHLAARLAREAFGTQNVDFGLQGAYLPLVAGVMQVLGGMGPVTGLKEVEASRVIVLLEGDLASTHPRLAFSVMKAIKAGARLVTIGCVITQMARLARLHLAWASGGHAEILNGLLAAALKSETNGQQQAVKSHPGLDAIRSSVGSASVSSQLSAAADWLLLADRAVFIMGGDGASGDQLRKNAAALASLAAVTGHTQAPGSGILLLAERCNGRGAAEIGLLPHLLRAHPLHGKSGGERRTKPLEEKTPMPWDGFEVEGMLQRANGLVAVATDPLAVFPAKELARTAVEQMECIVALDAFPTATTELAHVVLPIGSFAETEGTYTSLDGSVQRVRAATKPPGGAKEGWQALAMLLERCGSPGPYKSAGEVFGEIASAMAPYRGMTYQELEASQIQKTHPSSNGQQPKLRATDKVSSTTREFPKLLVRSGTVDWGGDPLVSLSPTLARMPGSLRKLFPGGLVEIAKRDAEEIGVRQGWKVKLTSKLGEVTLPVVIRTDLEPGVVLLPFAFREHAAPVTGGKALTWISIEAR